MNAKHLKSYMTLQKLVARKFRQANQSPYTVYSNMGSCAQIFSGFDLELVPVYPQLRNVLQVEKYVVEALQMATYRGYNADLCSDLRCEIGKQYVVDELRAKLPPADFVFAMNFTCNASVGLFDSWLQLNPEAEHYLVDVPHVVGDEVPESSVDYVHAQLLEVIAKLERFFKLPFDVDRFRSATVWSGRSMNLMNDILKLSAHNPSPISLTSFQPYLIPLAYYNQFEETYDYLVALKKELEEVIQNSQEQKERIRLCWDFLPFYKYMPDVEALLKEHDAKIVTGTSLTSAMEWPSGEWCQSTDDPVRLLAYTYVQHHFKRNYRYKADVLSGWIKEGGLHGIIFHSARNCKAHSLPHFLVMEELQKELGIPTLVIEADVLDPKAYSKSYVLNRLEAFLETL